jgi:hypothetical protein
MHLNQYLYVFNQVLSDGELCNGRYYLDNLSAWHDIDGYTCYLGYKDLTLTLYFHSRFSFEFSEKETMRSFTKLIEKNFIALKVK